jgi:hypothetical protein
MQLLTMLLVRGVRLAAAALTIAGVVMATPQSAAAQAVGDAVPFAVTSGNGVVIVGPVCDPNVTEALGGLTLFGSRSPSGPYVGVLPQPGGRDGGGNPNVRFSSSPGCRPAPTGSP